MVQPSLLPPNDNTFEVKKMQKVPDIGLLPDVSVKNEYSNRSGIQQYKLTEFSHICHHAQLYSNLTSSSNICHSPDPPFQFKEDLGTKLSD